MSLDPQDTFQLDWDDLPLDPTGTAAGAAIANFMGDHSTGKLEPKQPPILLPGPGTAIFTFGTAAALAVLSSGFPASSDPVPGRTKLADAWKAGILAGTLVIPAGTSITTPPSPPTSLYSAPPAVVVNPAALDSAYADLLSGLLSAPLANSSYGDILTPPVPDPFATAVPPIVRVPPQMPILLYEAFLALKFDLDGVDSSAPTPAPLMFTTDVQ